MSYIRRASSTTDRYGSVCYRIDGEFIRQASRTTDRYGSVCYRIDGEFIRQASSTTDRYGAVRYRIDGEFIRQASSTTDRYGAVLYRIDGEFIRQASGLDLINFASVQLANEPFDNSRKRVRDCGNGFWVLGCRTWRMIFSALPEMRKIKLLKVESNYRTDELQPGAEDRYMDKEIHRRFILANMGENEDEKKG